MKRCNNCGWYNQDSAVSCEKCQDVSFKAVVMPEEEAAPVIQPEKAADNPVMETVAFGGGMPAAHDVSSMRRKYAATVLDAGSSVKTEEEITCHKCRYPIVGNVEYCPNCGATVRANAAVNQAPAPQGPKVVDRSALKATVRDVSDCIGKVDSEVFRLVPVDEPGEHPYELRVGDVVVIGGCRYKFQK